MLVSMKRLTLIGLKEEEDQVLAALQEISAVEIIQGEDSYEDERLARTNDSVAALEQNIRYLRPYSKKKSSFAALPEYNVSQLFADTDEAMALSGQVEELEKRCLAAQSAQERQQALKEQLLPYETLEIPLEDVCPTRCADLMIGIIDAQGLEALERLRDSSGGLVELTRLCAVRETYAVFIAAHGGLRAELADALRRGDWVEAAFPKLSGTPRERIAACEKEIDRLTSERQSIEEQALELGKRKNELLKASDAHAVLRDRYLAKQRLGRTESTFLLDGWMRAEDEETVRRTIALVTEHYVLETRDPLEDETPPSVVQNKKLISPFEAVTNLYSKPAPGGLDPTPFMAPFYFVFFGMMVSDAGYGVAMMILGAIYLKLSKPRGMVRQVGLIVAYGGLSTLFWGVMFGGYFGLTSANVAWLPKALFMDPLSDPMMMLIVCFAMGLIQIYCGLILNIKECIRRKDYVTAFADKLTWIIILAGVVLLLAGVNFMIYPVLACAAVVVLFSKRHHKNWFKRIFIGFAGLYDITGYLSDILSYSRLFALGISTGIIATVMNTLGGMLFGSAISSVFGVAVLLGGHLFNLGINVLGAFVHDARLQFIEYYGKFYESGGKDFKPLGYRTKHVKIMG